MAEFIDRQAASDALAKLCKRVCQYSEKQRQYMCGACPLGDAFTVIEDDLPAADVRPVPEGGIGEMSDGYHTFNGLYYQRMVLFAALVKAYKDKAWKSHRHEDGELCFGGGWFIVGIDTPEGSYTYHYEDKDWDRFDCQELPVAKHWDGHREENVTRLLSLPETSINEKTALAMMAGSHAIRKHAKRYEGTTYMWDVFGECGGPKEISYLEAAKQLVSIADSVLDHEPPKEE